MSNREPSTPKIGNSPLEMRPIPRRKEREGQFVEIIFWEDKNPKSLLNLVTEKLRAGMRELPPSLLGMSENEIRKKLEPSWLQDQLRIAFWDEYFLTIDNNEQKMRPAAIYANICSKEHFYTQVENPLFLAYITKPPTGYMLKMRSLLDMAMERMREVLNLPLIDQDGVVNTKLISEIVKIAALADNRVKGAVTQKIQIDQTSKNLNVNATYEPPKTHQDLEKELKDIEKEILQLKTPSTEASELLGSSEGHGDVIEISASTAKT